MICLFQGLRLNEVCQLTLNDVYYKDNVLIMHVRGGYIQGQGKKFLKTNNAKRIVPVHRRLIEFGFLDFLQTDDTDERKLVFRCVRPKEDRYASDPISKRLNRIIDKSGIESKLKSFHSLRHSWKDEAQARRMARDVMLYLGGWKSAGALTFGDGRNDEYGNTADLYGSHPPIALLKQENDRVDFTGVRFCLDFLTR